VIRHPFLFFLFFLVLVGFASFSGCAPPPTVNDLFYFLWLPKKEKEEKIAKKKEE